MMDIDEAYEMGTLKAMVDIAIRELKKVTADDATDVDRQFARSSLDFIEKRFAEIEQKKVDKQTA